MQAVIIQPATPAQAVSGRDAALLAAGSIMLVGYAAMLLNTGGALLLPIAAVFVAALISSVAGFAFAAIGGAIMFHLLPDPLQVVQLLMVCSVANQTLAVWTLRRSINIAGMRPFLLPSALGVPIGAFLLLHTAPQAYLQVLGGVLVAWAIYGLLHKPVVLARTTVLGDMAFGFAAGILGGFAGFAGALIAVRCGLKGWDKTQQRGVFQPMIVIMQLMALGWLTAMRPSGGAFPVGLDALGCLPASLLGTFCGLAVFKRLTDRQFGKALNAMLIASGLALVV